jgi:uncharacterized protein YycO
MLASALAAAALAGPPALGSSLVDQDAVHRGAGARLVDPAELGALRPGDVIFLSAPKALWARLASQWSLPKYNHGHVGMIVAGKDGRMMVVHAAGDPTRNRATVRAVPVAKFLEEAEAATVFRMKDPAAARVAASEAARFARERLPFDTDFSLRSRDKLYCSEMVWRAMSAALHRDVVPHKYSDYGRPTIRLSDLETSADLTLVAHARAPGTAPL